MRGKRKRNMTPRELSPIVEETGRDEIRVTDTERARWEQSPLTVSRMQWMVIALGETWERILNAGSWEEYLQFRGAYRMLEGLLNEEPLMDKEFTAPERVEQIRTLLKEVLYERRNDESGSK